MLNIQQKQTNHGPTAPEAGFSLVEVMIAALVMVLLTVNLLALVAYAGMFRLKAKQSNEAGNWIQQDLENVKLKANQFQIAKLMPNPGSNTCPSTYPYTSTSTSYPNGTTSVIVNQVSVGGISFAVGNTLKIGTDSVLHTITGINTNACITFTPALNIPQDSSNSSQQQVWVGGSGSICSATASTTGLAQALSASLDPVVASTKTIAGQSYTLTRTATPKNTAPYQTLAVSYAVAPTTGGGATIQSLQTEVVPNAAFGCP